MSKDIANCIVQALDDDYNRVSHRRKRLQDIILCQTPDNYYNRPTQKQVLPTAFTENERKDMLYYKLLNTPYKIVACDVFYLPVSQTDYVEYDVYSCEKFNHNDMSLIVSPDPTFKMRYLIATDQTYLMQYMHQLGFVIISCREFSGYPYLYPISKIVNFDVAKSVYDNKL